MLKPARVVHGNVVALCESLLVAARQGLIAALAVSWERPEGGTGFTVAHGAETRPACLLGQVTIMQLEMAARMRNNEPLDYEDADEVPSEEPDSAGGSGTTSRDQEEPGGS